MQGLAPGILTAGNGLRYAKWDINNVSTRIGLTEPARLMFTGTVGQSGIGSATIGKSSGKWYWEIFITSNAGNSSQKFGLINYQPTTSNTGNLGNLTGTIGYRGSPRCIYYNFTGQTDNGSSCNDKQTGDVFSFALNMDANTFTVYRTRTAAAQQSTTISGIPAGTWYPGCGSGSSAGFFTANFGQNAWDTRTAALRGVLEALELYNIGLFNE